jgi:GT2 family glycosyltransferase
MWSLRRPLLSVVTPLYNCLALTQAMVESLLATLPPRIGCEVILVDDCSTDGTREWLSGLGEPFRVVLNERNLGFGAATNRGAAQARGEVLALLNNDLVLRPGWLAPMLFALRSLGSRAGVVGNVQLNAATGEVDHAGIALDEKCKPAHERRIPGPLSLALRPYREVFALTGACLLLRARTWRRLGGFDEGYFNGCEDVDLCMRAREAGLRNVIAYRSRVLHHVSASPGRKLRDEQNTMRLVLRWRDEFAKFACRDRASWELAWDYFWASVPEPRDTPDPREVLTAALFLLRLSGEPPVASLEPKDAIIDLELARWREMFSH